MRFEDLSDSDGKPSGPVTRVEPVQQRGAERLNTILDAAGAVVDEVGPDRVTTAMIAKRAGASIGTVYRYFPDRVAVLHALRERAVSRFHERILIQMSENPPQNWWEAIDYSVTVLTELYRTEPGFRAIHLVDRERVQAKDSTDLAVGLFAHRLAGLLAADFGLPEGEDLLFRLEIAVETSDALISRAFQLDPNGDERFISECRRLVHDYLAVRYDPARRH